MMVMLIEMFEEVKEKKKHRILWNGVASCDGFKVLLLNCDFDGANNRNKRLSKIFL